MESGQAAIDHIKARDAVLQPELIFLDINMPGMDGWEFIEHYKLLDNSLQKAMIVVMLTTSDNPDDIARARTQGILSDFKTKPLTKEMLSDVITTYCRENEL